MAYKKQIDAGEFKTFAIIREPLSRLVSGFCEVCKRATNDSPHILDMDFYWMKGKPQILSFLDVLEKRYFDAQGNETNTDYLRMLKLVKSAGYNGFIGVEYEGSGLSEVDGILATKNLLLEKAKLIV